MPKSFLKSLIAVSIICIFPITSYAEDKTNNSNLNLNTVKDSCSKTWAEKAGPSSDPVAYKNFGEKYCNCAASQIIEKKVEIKKAAMICIPQILLQDTMDNLSDEKGLSNTTADDIMQGCTSRWDLVYANSTDQQKDNAAAYCGCAKSKLADLAKNSDNYTDKEYYEKINAIAGECLPTKTGN